MNKKIIAIILALVMIVCISGCNYQVVDFTYQYKYGVLSLPNGEIVEGEINSWKDYEASDQIQVNIDGITYLVHSADIVLMTEKEENILEAGNG